jgi:hypothetical protein
MSTKTFKAGDRVRCVNSSDAFPLTTGAEYTVGRSFPHPDYADLPLLDLDGVNRGGRIGFRADRFELIKAGVPGAVGQRVRFVKNYEPFGIAAGDTGTIVLNDNTLCPYKIRIDRRLPYPWGNGLIWMRAENVELLPRIEAAKPLPGGFKAGDKVRLKPGVALWGPVKPGVTYVVSEERADIANMIRIKDEKGNKAGGWEASKFEKVPAQVAFLERYEVLLRDLHHPIFAPRVYPPAGLADFSYIKAPLRAPYRGPGRRRRRRRDVPEAVHPPGRPSVRGGGRSRSRTPLQGEPRQALHRLQGGGLGASAAGQLPAGPAEGVLKRASHAVN